MGEFFLLWAEGSKPWTSVWYQLTVLIGAKNVQDRGKSGAAASGKIQSFGK